MDIAKVEGSALSEVVEILGGGTGMYEVMRDTRACFWIEYSGSGPSGVCMLTARPLKHGILL